MNVISTSLPLPFTAISVRKLLCGSSLQRFQA